MKRHIGQDQEGPECRALCPLLVESEHITSWHIDVFTNQEAHAALQCPEFLIGVSSYRRD